VAGERAALSGQGAATSGWQVAACSQRAAADGQPAGARDQGRSASGQCSGVTGQDGAENRQLAARGHRRQEASRQRANMPGQRRALAGQHVTVSDRTAGTIGACWQAAMRCWMARLMSVLGGGQRQRFRYFLLGMAPSLVPLTRRARDLLPDLLKKDGGGARNSAVHEPNQAAGPPSGLIRSTPAAQSHRGR
jgi:hypothetical protein